LRAHHTFHHNRSSSNAHFQPTAPFKIVALLHGLPGLAPEGLYRLLQNMLSRGSDIGELENEPNMRRVEKTNF
jgi:hypothetical protein